MYPAGALLSAPLSGYTDLPYRRALRRCGCTYAFTEMIDASALVYARARTEHMLTRGAEEPWLGVQLVSANLEHIAIAARILNDYDFDVVDFNLGCPVPKVAKKGAGAALGKDIEKAADAFAVLCENSRHKVTAKIRILSRESATPTLELIARLTERGAQAVTVHGRLMKEFYAGEPAFDVIRAAVEEFEVPIIANGGVFGVESAQKMLHETGAERLMLARGAMGNPWLFTELAEPAAYTPPNIDELVEMMQFHVLGLLDFYGEERGIRIGRKIVLDYLRGRGFPGEWRAKAALVASKQEFMTMCDQARAAHNGDYFQHPPRDRRIRA